MTKREMIIGVSGFAVAVVLAAAGYRLFVYLPAKQPANLSQQTVGNHIISLNQPAGPDSTGGLRVSSGATSLGQLGGQTSDSSAGSQSSGTGSSGGLNPATFGQYDKYQDDPNALFAEMQVGSGAELAAGKKAAVLYKGWLTNGTLIDQSRTGSDGKLQPFVFTLGSHEVIPGWEEGLSGMRVGGVRLVIIPPAVGYGAQGQGPVPGNAVLVFQVQLLDVQ